ncbi:MAG: aldo/keto reductase [Bacteroidetes bacterium]|nr:aldo/keto reductase [Bacteroidota bacterium]
MEKKNQSNGIKRREFLRTGAAFAASALFLPLSGTTVFGALNANQTKKSIPAVTLNNGITMPRLGFGTNTLNDSTCVRCVAEAISVGYRLIDTANIYGNEESVGAGIKQSGIKREELFVTSKLWVDDAGYESTKKAYQTSLNKLGLEYLDLYLIHRPRGDFKGSWKAMEELYEAGKIRAIGVSNFEPEQLADLMAYAKIKPVINQIETHVFFQEHISYEALKKNEVQMEAWSPFAAGRNEIFSNPTLAAIGKKHNKSIAQVCLRWHYQRGVVAIPRSSQKAHMIENLVIFDFELDESDMHTIATLDLNTTQFPEWG